MSPKIFQICSVLPPGSDAVGEAAVKLMLLLEKEGYDCSILTSSNQKKGRNIYPFVDNWGLFNILKAIRFLKQMKAQVVVFHYPTPLYKREIFVTFISFFCKLARIKFVPFIHEYFNYSILGKIRILPLLVFGYRIITTDYENFYAMAKIPFVREKTSVIAVGSNFPDEMFNFVNDRQDKKIQKDGEKLQLLYFGYIMQGKGLEYLFNAFEEYPKLKEKYKLNIVGKIPEFPDKESVELIKKLNSATYLTYHGFLSRDKLLEIFREIDVVCFPFEQGVTIRRSSFMTAIGFGKFVLTTESKLKIEDLEHMRNVFFIKTLTSRELMQGLIFISNLSTEIREEVGQRGKEWYMKNYSEKIYISKILEVVNF